MQVHEAQRVPMMDANRPTPRQGVMAALPNTQKQAQGDCQNEEIKKHGPNERTD